MTTHRPSVNALILETNIPIVVRNGADQLVSDVLPPVGQFFVFLLSFCLILELVVGLPTPTFHYLTIKSLQPLRYGNLKLNLHSVGESQLRLAPEVNANRCLWNKLLLPVRVGGDMDVIVAVPSYQSRTSNFGFLWDLLQATNPQPLLHPLKSELPVSDVVGIVELLERDGIQLSLELQPPDLVSFLLQRTQTHQRPEQPCLDALLHLGGQDFKVSCLVFITDLDGDFSQGCVCVVHIIVGEAVVVEPLGFLEQTSEMLSSSLGQMRAVYLGFVEPCRSATSAFPLSRFFG